MQTRTGKGTFKAGNPGGPGRPPRVVELDYLRLTVGQVSREDWSSIVARAVADAKAGNHRAREWLGLILMGPPGADRDAPPATATTVHFVLAAPPTPPTPPGT